LAQARTSLTTIFACYDAGKFSKEFFSSLKALRLALFELRLKLSN